MNKNVNKILMVLAAAAMLVGCTGKGNKTDSTIDSSSIESESQSESSSQSGENHNVDIDVPELTLLDEPSVYFHYWRGDGKYTSWDMWIWEKDHDGAAFDFNYKDDWGVVAAYPLSTWTDAVSNSLGFIVRKGGDSWADKDLGGNDKFLDFALFEKDERDSYHVYLISGKTDIYIDTEGNVKGMITMATFARKDRVVINANLQIQSYVLKESGEVLVQNDSAGKVKRVEIKLPEDHPVDYTKAYHVDVKFVDGSGDSSFVSKNLLFASEDFGNAYNYSGDDLGATLGVGYTTFKVWSPLSTSIKLRIYDTGTPASLGGSDEHEEYTMVKGEKGVFTYEVPQELEGKYYTYVVTNEQYSEKEVVDPYAKSAGVNGARGMVVDFSKTNPVDWDSVTPHQYDRKEMVIYETHVADVTSSKTWTGTEANRKLFKGMYETGTTYTENGVTVKTGFDHIKELGVNAVQIIPIFDQANDELNPTFNWGYNPLNYNALEGSYSSNPHDGYARIKEFKELVKAYNENDINIIMDVVYNHVAGAQGCNFDVLMPGYYFRYTNGGAFSNGSGCGNETASELYMMRKFMIDSTTFWAKEYKLGGFRFDLMGLHDLTTMEQLTAACKLINPSICIFGEPWTGGTSPLPDSDSAKQLNGNKYVGYGAFNDQMRDALIKGGLSGPTEVGWIDDNKDPIGSAERVKITRGMQGITSAASVINDPDKTINYVTCHDNRTLYDRFIATKRFTEEDDDLLEKMNVLANAVVMTSQGTSFMLAGEEFLRTKQGNENSYNASYEVNELNYALKVKHHEMFERYQYLIALKESTSFLHLDKDNNSQYKVSISSDGSLIKATYEDNAAIYAIYHNNGLKDNVENLDGYTLQFSTLGTATGELTAETTIQKYESIYAIKVKQRKTVNEREGEIFPSF